MTKTFNLPPPPDDPEFQLVRKVASVVFDTNWGPFINPKAIAAVCVHWFKVVFQTTTGRYFLKGQNGTMRGLNQVDLAAMVTEVLRFIGENPELRTFGFTPEDLLTPLVLHCVLKEIPAMALPYPSPQV